METGTVALDGTSVPEELAHSDARLTKLAEGPVPSSKREPRNGMTSKWAEHHAMLAPREAKTKTTGTLSGNCPFEERMRIQCARQS
jgi:hypothetical protein